MDGGKAALRSERLRPTRLSAASARRARALRAAYFSLRGVAEVGTVTPSRGTARAKARGSGQERGKEWKYRVIAVSKACLCGYARRQACEGQPSNTLMAVL